MNILIIGSGGREHTLAWKINQSPRVKKIYCTPGNAGMSEIAECVDIKADDVSSLIDFAKEKNIDLTVAGPEAPLVAGIVDEFEKNGLNIFGPCKGAAQLEGSKIFTKEFLKKYQIPSADFAVFSVNDKKEAEEYCNKKGVPLVLKADGLAAGKGVYVCLTADDLDKAVKDLFDDKIFGSAGDNVLIEECLIGEEVSVLAFSDGRYSVIMESSQDHKRVFDNDKGSNTGGMGAYSPAPVLTDELANQVYEEIIIPTIHGMDKEGYSYKGILYAGLMITKDGPMVLEYNVRFGDPEAQVVIPRLESDLVEIMEACIYGNLKDVEIKWDKGACICLVLASDGYPGKYEKNKKINVNDFYDKKNTILFHAGVTKKGQDIVTNGGRVMGLTVKAKDIETCIENVYREVENINFQGMFYRKDIGAKALKSCKKV